MREVEVLARVGIFARSSNERRWPERGMQSADWLSLIELWPPLQHTANLLFRLKKIPWSQVKCPNSYNSSGEINSVILVILVNGIMGWDGVWWIERRASQCDKGRAFVAFVPLSPASLFRCQPIFSFSRSSLVLQYKIYQRKSGFQLRKFLARKV